MNPAVQRFLLLRIDVSLPDQAAESGLDMRAGAAETVVKIEVAEGRVQVVSPEQAHHPAAKPDAFRVASRAGQRTGGLGDLIDLLLAFLRGIGLCGICGRFLRLGRLARRLPGRRNSEPPRSKARQKPDATRKKTALSPSDVFFYLALRRPSRPVLQPDWDANTAVFSLVKLPCTPAVRINLNFNQQHLP